MKGACPSVKQFWPRAAEPPDRAFPAQLCFQALLQHLLLCPSTLPTLTVYAKALFKWGVGGRAHSWDRRGKLLHCFWLHSAPSHSLSCSLHWRKNSHYTNLLLCLLQAHYSIINHLPHVKAAWEWWCFPCSLQKWLLLTGNGSLHERRLLIK